MRQWTYIRENTGDSLNDQFASLDSYGQPSFIGLNDLDGLNDQFASLDLNDQPFLIGPDDSDELSKTDQSLFSVSCQSLTAEGVPLDTFNLASFPSDPLDPSVEASLDKNLDTVSPLLSDPNYTAFLGSNEGSEGDDRLAFIDDLDDASLQPSLFSEDYVGK